MTLSSAIMTSKETATRPPPQQPQQTPQVRISLSAYQSGISKLCQLEALTASLSGPGFAPFRQLNPDLQESLASLVADLVQDTRRALEQGCTQ